MRYCDTKKRPRSKSLNSGAYIKPLLMGIVSKNYRLSTKLFAGRAKYEEDSDTN